MIIKYNNFLIFADKNSSGITIFKTIKNNSFFNSINFIYYDFVYGQLCFYYYDLNNNKIYLDFDPINRSKFEIGTYGIPLYKKQIINKTSKSLSDRTNK